MRSSGDKGATDTGTEAVHTTALMVDPKETMRRDAVGFVPSASAFTPSEMNRRQQDLDPGIGHVLDYLVRSVSAGTQSKTRPSTGASVPVRQSCAIRRE